MARVFVEEQTFSKVDYTHKVIEKGEYEYCTFDHCNFLQSDISDIRFMECEFISCNLSMVNISLAALQDVRFKDCKMLGIHFESCRHFGFAVHFDHCTLNHSSFYQLNLPKTTFAHTQLHEVDFTESNLTASLFDHCDLTNATFEASNLEKVDFRTSYNYSIDPEKNRVKKAIFSPSGLIGLLGKYDIEVDIRA